MNGNTKKGYLSDLSKITKGAGITLCGTVIGKGFLFIFTIYLAKKLGVGDLGIYFLGITIIKFLSILACFGLGAGATRFIAIHAGEKDLCRMKGTVLFISAMVVMNGLFIIVLISFLGDYFFISVFNKPDLANAIMILSFALPFESLMRILLASTRGLKYMHYTAYTNDLAWVISRMLFAVFFVSILDLGLKGALLAYVLSTIIAASMALFFVNKHVPMLSKKVKAKFENKKLLRFSIPMVITALMNEMMTHLDILMLGVFVSASDIGIYSVVVRILGIAKVIFMAFQPIFQPFVADLSAKKEFERLSSLLQIVTQWSVMLSFPIFLLILVFPEFFLSIFGSEFSSGSRCLVVLASAVVISSIATLPGTMIFMSGRSDITLKNNAVVLFINLILLYLFIPRYGIIGAAFATGISFIIFALIRITEVFVLMKCHPFRWELWKPLFAGVMSIILIHFIQKINNPESLFGYLPFMIVFFILYLLILYSLRLNEELLYIRDLVKKKLFHSSLQA